MTDSRPERQRSPVRQRGRRHDRGGEGNNTIVGGQDSSDGGNSITAGSGDDLIWGNGGADTISADGGANTVVGGFGNNSLLAGDGDDIIFGNEDSDTIDAGDGANLIFGGFGDDSVLTGSGNDTLWGNEGNDTMAGGAGADRYVFATSSGNDQVNGFGFAEGDRLDLSGQTFTTGTSADGDVVLLLSGGGTIELNGVPPGGFTRVCRVMLCGLLLLSPLAGRGRLASALARSKSGEASPHVRTRGEAPSPGAQERADLSPQAGEEEQAAPA